MDPDFLDLCRINKINDPKLMDCPLPYGNLTGMSARVPLQGGFRNFYKPVQIAEKQIINNEYRMLNME